MSDELGKFNWIAALVVSAVLHVFIVGAWVLAGRSAPEPPVGTPAAGQAATNATPPTATDSETSPTPASDSASETKTDAKPSDAIRPADTPRRASPVKKKPEKAKPPADEAADAASSAETSAYVVKKGDNLSKIAQAHGITLQELKTLNKETLRKAHALWVGQKLKVPKVPR